MIGHIVRICHQEDNFISNDFIVGDRVAAFVRNGGNARYANVPISSLVRVPRHIDSTQAAAMVSIYSAAFKLLKEVTPLHDGFFSLVGKTILIILGRSVSKDYCAYDKCNTSGVIDDIGLALVQMCQKSKADMIYVIAPESRHCFIKTVLHAIPLNCNQIDDSMDRIEGKIDYVFDGVCEYGLQVAYGAVKKEICRTMEDRSVNNFNKSFSNISSGRIICYGHLSMLSNEDYSRSSKFNSWRKVLHQSHVRQAWTKSSNKKEHVSITFMNLWDSFEKDRSAYKSDLKYLFQLLLVKKVQPIISKRISLHEVENEHRKKLGGDNCSGGGIVVCLPWKSKTN
jgi:hypothetical protein